ncbi:putative polyol transporter 6 [Capsicum baccatum]|uniref:Polyol transporter 6 n=1 Tax=Capsicum baccatum TaxID=33114 RepID=A0A2G2XMP2_CAPBA|nr:putative polyol transporter 6 [Capsicum baccatum]
MNPDPPEQRPGISLIPREETRSTRTGTRLGLSNGKSDEYEREYNSAMDQFSQDPNTDDDSGMEFDSEALHYSDTSVMEKGGVENPNKINKYACACSIVDSIISIIFGYDTGVMSGAMIFVKEEFHISDVKTRVLAGILNLCALVGSLSAGRTSDYVGRRYTIFIALIILLIGFVIMGYSPTYAVLLVGRCVARVGVGFALMIALVYSSEVSSLLTYGFLTSLPEIGISTGILLGYLSNYIFSGLPLRLWMDNNVRDCNNPFTFLSVWHSKNTRVS